MATLVPDWGSPHSRLVLIGEAPGQHEEAQRRPFVGPSGMLLQRWWADVGLQRSDFMITNVYPYRPPGNDISTVDRRELAGWVDALHDRIADLTDPWVLVPTGNTALEALTGKRSITKHRGSVYEYTDRRGRRLKVIPTIHPAATFRQSSWERRCRHDWRRIAADADFRDLRLPLRDHRIRPSTDDVADFVGEVSTRANVLALDIETPGSTIACVGFAFEPHWSLTIPTELSYWGDSATLAWVWDQIKLLCLLPCEKALQNGHFDTYWLAGHGVRVANWRWDCLAQHHCLDATDAHDLAYMASVDTRQPYWKDEAKAPEEIAKYASHRDALWTYNGIDACVQRELAETYAGRLADRGALGFYGRHYTALFAPLLRVMRHGVRLDAGACRRRFTALTAGCVSLQERLAALAGAPLHATARSKKDRESGKLPDLSNTKVKAYFYEQLGLPKVIKRTTGKPTADEVTVRRLMLKYPQAVPAGTLILEHRRKKKLSEFLNEGQVDADGRLRCTYKFTTESGRLASSKNPTGTGRNLQNIDRDVRDVFLPDHGHVFVEVDLSQAESRVVYTLTGDTVLAALARLPASEYDVHRENAALIFHVEPHAVTPDQRYLAKRGVHAGHYGMHGTRLSEELLKDGVVVAPEEAQSMIDAYMASRQPILEWQRTTRAAVMRDRALVNSWGRMLRFDFERFDDDLYRRAYAFVPQSEIADLMNQWGLVPLDVALRARKMRSQIALHVHDALVVSCPPEEVWDVWTILKTSLERPRRYAGVELTIPCDLKLGRRWQAEKEWKAAPTREAVEQAVADLVGRGLVA